MRRWVEIAQQHDVPFAIAVVEVRQNPLLHGLRGAVGIRSLAERLVLVERHVFGVSVYRGAAAEDDVLATVVAGHVAQHQRAADIVAVVFQRLLHAFPDRLEAGEVIMTSTSFSENTRSIACRSKTLLR